MKQFTFIAALFIALVVSTTSCSKNSDALLAAPETESYFSRIRKFTDGRQPSQDTLTTIKILNEDMLNEYRLQDGKIIEETSTYVVRGKLWQK